MFQYHEAFPPPFRRAAFHLSSVTELLPYQAYYLIRRRFMIYHLMQRDAVYPDGPPGDAISTWTEVNSTQSC